jgi:hypothetical protein
MPSSANNLQPVLGRLDALVEFLSERVIHIGVVVAVVI